jgi:hypothetical protein
MMDRKREGEKKEKSAGKADGRVLCCPLSTSRFIMSATPREYFTVDLRGLRAALSARAARDGLTESDVLRSALAVALGDAGVVSPTPIADLRNGSPATRHVKLSVRVSLLVAHRLDLNGRAAGLSRGAYLMRLIDAAPPVIASIERAAGFAALNASASELAVLSRDINHLTHLLRSGSVAAAREYRGRLGTLDGDVRKHLELSASVIAELMSDRKGRTWARPSTSSLTRSSP